MPPSENWARIKQIVSEALELQGTRREQFVLEECAGDEALRLEVQSLIDAYHESDALSGDPSFGSLLAAFDPLKVIGAYHLTKKLGQGGMGQVWLAEQKSPVRRQVAIKLLNPGSFSSASMQRFESERQSLAMMEHPAIARVFDAGSAPDGRPYFVMEYVAGIPINDYCDLHRLTVTERLKVFKQVCEGVQHAHQKSIVHRDLKPSNILVTEVDGRPVPRIIDFGIAKTVSIGPREDETVFTQAGALIGTPGYMSPEQLDLKNADIDTRTDVYSLGVLLYVLLTGTMPFASVQWSKKSIDEILRELREKDPPSPSTRVASSEGTTLEAAGLRSTNPQQLASTLRGDLDWITMKAMEKDRERRYASPADLALDLQRYLENRPVLARPPSLGYRFQKYVVRNRILATAAALGTVLVIAFIGLLAVQLRRTTRERDRANRITEFMTQMFEVADPNEARGNTITVREVLDNASKDIESHLSNDPQLQAQMMSVMGDVYHRLGLLTKAETLLNKSMQTERRTLPLNDPEAASTTSRLASTLADEGKLADAERLLRPLVEVEKRKLGPENKKTLVCENLLATTLHGQGKFTEAVKMYRQVLEIQRRVYGPDDPITLTLMANIAAALADSGSHSPEIEELDNQVLASRRRTLGPDHPDTLRSMANLGIVLTSQGNRAAEAERLLQDTLDRQKRILGPEHPDTLGTMGALIAVYEQQYRYADEEKLARETLAIQQRVLGPEHGDTIAALANLAGCLGLEKRYTQAEEVSRQAIEIEKRVLPAEHPTTLQTKANLADILEAERRLPEADQLVREVLEIDQRVLGADNPMTIQALYILGKIQKDQKKLDDAETTLSQGRAIALRALPPDDPRTALYTYALAQTAALRGDRGAALRLLREVLDHGLDPPTTAAIEKEADFQSLHGDPNFRAILVQTHERKSATAPKSDSASK